MTGSLFAGQTLQVLVPGTPLPQGSKKIGTFTRDGVIRRSIIDNNPRLAQWRLQITSYVRAAMADKVMPPLWAGTGPIDVEIAFFFARPRSHYGTGRNESVLKTSVPRFPLKPPDVDKLIRAILDGCTDAEVWRDDAQVVTITAIKRWAAGPIGGVRILIRPMA